MLNSLGVWAFAEFRTNLRKKNRGGYRASKLGFLSFLSFVVFVIIVIVVLFFCIQLVNTTLFDLQKFVKDLLINTVVVVNCVYYEENFVNTTYLYGCTYLYLL